MKKNSKKIEVNVDEIAISFRLSDTESMLTASDFVSEYQLFISKLENYSIFSEFGNLQISNKAVAHYTDTYCFDSTPYCSVSFSSKNTSNGVLLKISAQSMSDLRIKTGIEVYTLFQHMSRFAKENNYNARITRCDIAIDYKNYGLEVEKIQRDIFKKDILFFKSANNHEVQCRKNGFFDDRGDARTIYFGNRRNSSYLRVYDKKVELIDKNSTSEQELKNLNINDWIRFELELKQDLAHNLGEIFGDIYSEEDYKNALLKIFTDRFLLCSRRTGKPVSYARELLKDALKSSVELRHDNRRHNDLNKLIADLYSSRFQNTLYKIRMLLGEEKAKDILNDLLEYNKFEYKSNREVEQFIRVYKKNITG